MRAIYSSMNNTGKAVAAGLAMAVLLGAGWWFIDRGPSQSVFSKSDSGATGNGSDAQIASALPRPGEPTTISAEWLNEIDASVRLLHESMFMSANVAGSIALLDILDARIARHEAKTLLAPLRAALASDREKLVAARSLDIAAIVATLDRLVLDLDVLPQLALRKPMLGSAKSGTVSDTKPSVSDTVPDTATDAATRAGLTIPSWQEIADRLMAKIAEVVRVRRVDDPRAILLTPDQSSLMAERLSLRLLSARLALLSRQEAIFLQDIAQAQQLLTQIFDPQDSRVVAYQQMLGQFAQLSNKVAIPVGLKASGAIEQLRQQTGAANPLAPAVPSPKMPAAPMSPRPGL